MRRVKEWIADDNTAIPPRVKVRIFDLFNGRCGICTLAIVGKLLPEYDHTIAICLGGKNRESNLRLLCMLCHKGKTKADAGLKKINNRVRAKHLGMAAPRQKIQSRGFAKAEPQRSASRPLKRTRTAFSSPESKNL